MGGAYLAFDLGASSWRAFIGREKERKFELEEIFRGENKPIEKEGGLFWNIEKIFYGIKKVLKIVGDRRIQLAAIGIDSWSVDYGLIDREGLLLEQPRCYRDPRNQGMIKKISEHINIRDLFLKTGVLAEDITTFCQLFAAKQTTPDILERSFRLLFIPDLLRYWLCGECATDFTLATTSQIYNLTSKCWDRDLVSILQVSEHILPDIRYGSSVLATISKEIQKETGLGPVPVTTGASHDTAAAFFTIKEDETNAILSSGTWSIIGIHMDQPLFSDLIDPVRFGYEGNPDGTVRLICNIPGMWILEQCRSIWKKKGINCSYESLIKDAKVSTHYKSIIDPYYSGFCYPGDMTEAIKIYCKKTGQLEPETPGEFFRAIMMGLAVTYVKTIQELENITKKKIKKLYIIGGGSQNIFLNQLIAEKAGVEVIKRWVEATIIGNLLNQQYALKSG